jgi:SNF2 family DNA or RNA helicase
MDGVATKKRNGMAREFEASGAPVLLVGTGTLNQGVTINGANHVIILNTEWSPETTLQAENRCHRPGQSKDVNVHYILSAGTVEEQMWELINAKAAAQQAALCANMSWTTLLWKLV